MTVRTYGVLGVLMMVALTSFACLNIGAVTPQDNANPASGTTADGEQATALATLNQQGNATVAGNGSAPGNGTAHPALGSTPPAADPTSSPNTSTPTGPAPPVVVDGANRFTLVGRFITTNPNLLTLSWLSNKIGVSFTGTSLSIVYSSSGNNRINLVLDGKTLPEWRFAAQSSSKTQTLVSQLPQGPHTLWITKATEFTYGAGVVNISNFMLDANANFYTPPAPLTRRIEAIGDSSYSSYGVMGTLIPGQADCDPTSNENADAAIPAVVAQTLGAEITNLSITGAGVLQSQYDSSTDPNHQLPFIYHHWQGGSYSPLWDFHVPMDVVLLSGGGDDIIGPSGSGAFSDANKFIATYAQWMLDARRRYPNASIFAVMSPNAKDGDRTTMMNALKAAVAQAQAAKPGGDPNMLFYDYFANDPKGWTVYDDVANAGGYGWGCSYHTSLTGSAFMAGRLAKAVKDHMGW